MNTKTTTGKARRRATPDNFVDGKDPDNDGVNEGLKSERVAEGAPNLFEKARKKIDPVVATSASDCYGTYSSSDPACRGCIDAESCASAAGKPDQDLLDLLEETRQIKVETIDLFIRLLQKMKEK